MFEQTRSAKRNVISAVLSSLMLLSGIAGNPTSARAEAEAQPLPSSDLGSALPVCAPLAHQLRWHEPFFGTREWREVAQETLSFASPACRQALRQGQAEEVVTALRTLEQWAKSGEPKLKRYVYRVACQLRVSSLREQIFAGTSEPGVYVDCVDAVFALGWTDQESVALRDRYLDGLAKEPLTTPIPPSALQAPYVERMAPVLAAYDAARLPKRDTLFAAMCLAKPVTHEALKAVCTGPVEREPQWAKEALSAGNTSLAISYLSTLSAHRLPEFVPILHRYDQQHLAGRDRLHRMLCQQRVLAAPELMPACLTLRDEAEPRWLHEEKTKMVNDELVEYHRVAVFMGKLLGLFSVLIIGHAIFVNRRRSLMELASTELPSEHGAA